MGAQWIHGQVDNVLYEYALDKDLVADPLEDPGIEGTGSFCREDGTLANCELLEDLIASLDHSKNMDDHEDNDDDDGSSLVQNMYDYFKAKFDAFLSGRRNLSDENIRLLKSVFRWFIIFEVIDNSCDNLRHISPLSYTEWEECDGVVDLINLKSGYHSVLKQMCDEFPLKTMLHLQTAVTKIGLIVCKYSNKVKVKLHTEKLLYGEKMPKDGIDATVPKDELVFDHVILTSSIGFLKEQLNTDFFSFTLPMEKKLVISALGFGTINKVTTYVQIQRTLSIVPFCEDMLGLLGEVLQKTNWKCFSARNLTVTVLSAKLDGMICEIAQC